ncbi:hypothetical protein [Actinotalea solisilvae]|uniref:hypothetical protein n=1 Tax=Actinotalea solisilvae TaxID=2072922 RepID=UPI0018F11C3A|nr:hypothetical protein [Actinotalea solisilvae]
MTSVTDATAVPRPHTSGRAVRALGVLALTLGAASAPAVAHASVGVPAPATVLAAPSGPCTDPEGVTVIVDKTDLGGEVEMGCATDASTGTAALQTAGFADTRDDANMICAIDALPDPCPTEFTGSYWSYWTAEPGGAWEMAMLGSDEAVPAPGGVEGWRYSDGSAGPTVDAPAAPTEEAADQAATSGEAEDVDDGTSVTTAEEEPQAAAGPSPVLLAGVGVVAVLAVAAVLVQRRRSAHGPAGQD